MSAGLTGRACMLAALAGIAVLAGWIPALALLGHWPGALAVNPFLCTTLAVVTLTFGCLAYNSVRGALDDHPLLMHR
jgi:hypothetical protein